MSEDVFNETKEAELARIAHKTAIDKDVQKNITKDEYYTVLDENSVVRARFGKISKGVFGMKIFDSTGEVVYEASDSAMTFRNVLPYNFDDSLDATYPLECEFYMPSNVSRINSCWVHIVGRNFRAYSTGAASGGGQTSSSGGGQEKTSSSGGGQTTSSGGGQTTSSGGGQTSSSGSSHTHSLPPINGESAHHHAVSLDSYSTGSEGADVSGNSGPQAPDSHTHASGSYAAASHTHTYNHATTTVDNGAHNHTYGGSAGAEGAHTHTVANHTHTVDNHTHSVSNHTHTVSIDAHTHSVAAHTHTMVFGIYEDTDITGTNVYVDNGSGYGASVANDTTPVVIDVNIASSLTITEGWKKIKITSSRLGRVVLVAILDIVISSA